MQNKTTAELEMELSDLVGESVTVDLLSEQSMDGVKVVVCNITYIKSHSEHQFSEYHQTAVVLDAVDLEFPEFVLSPSARGLAGVVFSRLGGFGDINFSDSPEFSEQYHLHGWNEEPVRLLFTKAARDHFAHQPGWHVRGKAQRLVIYKQNQVCEESKIPQFVKDCLPILELFQEGEQVLDAQPELRRQTEAVDVMATAQRMGGFVGNSIQRQLQKLMVSKSDLQTFVAAAPPRRIPQGIKRQVMGANLPLVFIGLLFVVAGLGVGTAVLTTMEGPFWWMGIPMVGFVPLVGGLMTVLTLMYRRKKTRVLREGRLFEGEIVSVEQTENSINNQQEHRVTIAFSNQGKESTATCSVYSLAANQAYALKESAEPVNVLVDPADPEHIICTDLLVVLG